MTTRQHLIDLVEGKRWFGDKSRTITGADQVWSQAIDGQSGVELAIIRYTFEHGEPSHYLVAIDRTGSDVTTGLDFTHWLAEIPATQLESNPNLQWRPFQGESLPDLSGLTARELGVEQSHTSIRFSDRVLIKVNRKLNPGISPEVELAAVIAKSTDRSFAATSYGALFLTGILNDDVCLALYSSFVPNQGDAWNELLDLLRSEEHGITRAEDRAAQIGATTARMHLGLLSDPWRADVAPEPVAREKIAEWESCTIVDLERLATSLASAENLDPRSQALQPLLASAEPALRTQVAGFHALDRTYVMRVHGDYHLGQMLRASDGAYVVVDFDGEPHRSLAERRGKYSALRDVAGMLRSFSYARGTIEQEATGQIRADLAAWESSARNRFLEAYIPIARRAPYAIIPIADDDIRRALNALEIEKAVYECWYELNNRPDWLWLPLTRLVQSR